MKEPPPDTAALDRGLGTTFRRPGACLADAALTARASAIGRHKRRGVPERIGWLASTVDGSSYYTHFVEW